MEKAKVKAKIESTDNVDISGSTPTEELEVNTEVNEDEFKLVNTSLGTEPIDSSEELKKIEKEKEKAGQDFLQYL